MKIYYNPELVEKARELRKNSTLSEIVLWNRLKAKQLMGYKFTRQKPISSCIVDFFCNRLKLVIEIDGSQHNGEKVKDRDEQRAMWLKERGYHVLRFWNNEVLLNMEGVLERIREALK